MMVYPCWNCESLVSVPRKINTRIFCEGCREEYDKAKAEVLDEYLEKKILVMWERAVNNIEKQEKCSMADYYDEAHYVKELALKDYNKFQSSAEMMAAMELLRKRVKTKVQHKILKYRVDFYLPELKIILEIDGKLHDFRQKKDSNRDVAILAELNANDKGWEITRIPTKYLEENLSQLVPAILALKKEKQKLRRANNGFIPASFSRRDAFQQRVVAEHLNDPALNEIDKLLDETAPAEK